MAERNNLPQKDLVLSDDILLQVLLSCLREVGFNRKLSASDSISATLQSFLQVVELLRGNLQLPSGLQGCQKLQKLTCKGLQSALPSGAYVEKLEVLDVSFHPSILDFPLPMCYLTHIS